MSWKALVKCFQKTIEQLMSDFEFVFGVQLMHWVSETPLNSQC